jgi:hypothetical protein
MKKRRQDSSIFADYITSHHFITILVPALLSTILASKYAPELIAPVVKERNSLKEDRIELGVTTACDGCAEPGFRPVLFLRVPQNIKIYESASVSASLRWNPSQGAIEAKLQSSDFKIVGAETSKDTDWSWLISPEQPGERKLLLLTKPPVHDLTIRDQPGSDNRISDTEDGVILNIRVLTSLGLTVAQDTWARAIGAFLTLVGTIAGYKFWENWRRNKQDNQQSSPTPDSTNVPQSGKGVNPSSKRKKR